MSRLHRWLLAMAGAGCVVLGAVGVFVPGLPTTVFLIAASWLFTKSCPVLEEKLLGARIFKPYRRFLEPGAPMPIKARCLTIAIMWTGVAGSGLLLWRGGSLSPAVAAVLAAAAAAGTAAIVRFRRTPASSTASRGR